MSHTVTLNQYRFRFNKLNFGIFLIYLFHISAILGAIIGFEEWFITKTPLNLSLMLVILIWLFPIDSARKSMASLIFL
jgi:putative membrane protein